MPVLAAAFLEENCDSARCECNMGLSHALSQRVRARPEEDDETENIGESDSSVGFDEEEDMILDESDVSEETANDDEVCA